MPEITNTPADFASALAELEKVVSEMEKPSLKLETALEQFSKGVALVKACQKMLTQSEQTVKILTEQNGAATLETFSES